MEIEESLLPSPAIYDSLEVLDDYLSRLRKYREQRRQILLEIERLCAAITRVRQELDAVQRDAETDISIVLQGVLQEFERRLEAKQQLAPHAAAITIPPKVTQHVATTRSSAEEPASNRECPPEIIALQPAILGEQHLPAPSIPEEQHAPHPLVLTTAVDVDYRERSADEIEQYKCSWLDAIKTLTTRWAELENEGMRLQDQSLNRPACLRLRALACDLSCIQAEADALGLHTHIIKSVTALRDRMELARGYAGDKSDILPFDTRFRIGDSPRLAVEDWDELAHLYEAVAEAQEAWDWYARTRDDYGGSGHHALLNAIGAIQQMLFRALAHHGSSDRLQGDLYGNLREAASTVGFLSSLNADTEWEELEEIARRLPQLYITAQDEVVIAQEKRARDERKAGALNAILRWHQEHGNQSVSADLLPQICDQLLPLLDACIVAGIPATNVQVRGSILDVAPIVLKDLPQYSKFLEAVLAERKRKGLDAVESVAPELVEEEDLPDFQIVESKEYVSMLTEGQKVLILGGSARPQVADKLKQLLQCASVDWLDSKKGDRMNKFKVDITRADIIVIVKKFASHEMTEKGREWAKDYNKRFVLLPSGYGVNQIVNQIYLQLVQPELGKRACS